MLITGLDVPKVVNGGETNPIRLAFLRPEKDQRDKLLWICDGPRYFSGRDKPVHVFLKKRRHPLWNHLSRAIE